MAGRLAVLSLLWGAISCGTGGAAEIKPGLVVPPHRMVRVTPAAGERVFVMPMPGPNQPAVDLCKTADGDLAWVGPPGTYFVFWFSEETQGQATVTIGEAPPVPPGPNPPGPDPPVPPAPTPGLARVSYDEALKINRPDHAKALAAIYAAGSSQLAALGGEVVLDISTVIATIARGTEQALGTSVALWQPWRDVMRKGLNAVWDNGTKDRDSIVKALGDIARGLEAAGGK